MQNELTGSQTKFIVIPNEQSRPEGQAFYPNKEAAGAFPEAVSPTLKPNILITEALKR
jgi:hypothetical protein